MSLTVGSLFSGIGGFDLGLERAGFTVKWQVEIDDYCRAVLGKHWPHVPCHADITTIDWEWIPRVDLVCGGFPCQPFSVAGKRRGKEDDRYLWPEVLRVCDELRPSWIIGENVNGLTTMGEQISTPEVESRTIGRNPEQDNYTAVLTFQERMLLDGILSDVERIGYEVQAFVIPACGIGAPHERYRIFIVAYSNGRQFIRQKREIQTMRNDGKDYREADREINALTDTGIPCGADVADSDNEGLQGREQHGTHRERIRGEWQGTFGTTGKRGNVRNASVKGFQNGADRTMGGREPFAESQRSAWWTVEPDVGRVVNGVPSRVDRLKCLGNAVVPQQAYPIFKAIAEIEKGLI